MIEPVIVDVQTKMAPADAFTFFVENMHKFWPEGHSIGTVPRTDLVIELKEGGRWYEICGDQQCDWGKVLSFEPGKSVLFAWHLNADWAFDPDVYTEVLVTFEKAETGTNVRLVHSKLERYGEVAPAIRESLSAATGWPDIMGAYAKAA